MKKEVSTLFVILFLIAVGSLAREASPVIVAKRKDTSAGIFVIYIPASSGSFRATVYHWLK